MTAILFPRLDPLAVDRCLLDLDRMVEMASRPLTEERLPAGTGWSAIGGAQIDLTGLGELRALVVDVASGCGFPGAGGVADRAKFDFMATVALASGTTVSRALFCRSEGSVHRPRSRSSSGQRMWATSLRRCAVSSSTLRKWPLG